MSKVIKDKPNKSALQYGTLDVLLMYLLGYKQKVVRIRKDSFDYHSYWFSKQPLRCVSVEFVKDKQGTEWVVLTRRNQQAIQNHLTKFFVLYEQDKVKTPYRMPLPLEWNLFVYRWVRWVLVQRRMTFSFVADRSVLDSESEICAFHCMTRGVYALLHQKEAHVHTMLNTFTGIVSYIEKDGTCYITFKMPQEVGRQILVMFFGYPFMHWRIRLFSRQASYKGHPVKFHSAQEKEKKLLDLLLKTRGRVSIDVVSKELGMETKKNSKGKRTLASITHSLQTMGNKIRKKAVDACRGSEDTVDFIITVARGWVTMEDDSPIK